MRRMLASIGLLVFGFGAGYVANSMTTVRAQTVTVTAVSTLNDSLAAVVIGGRVFTCSGIGSNQWTCRAVQLKLPE